MTRSFGVSFQAYIILFLYSPQEMIVRDSGSGWDLGPELDHFSSRTRHVLQYMNPNKINMDLILDLLAYLGKITSYSD